MSRWTDSTTHPDEPVGAIEWSKSRAIFDEGFFASHEAGKKEKHYAWPAKRNGFHMYGVRRP